MVNETMPRKVYDISSSTTPLSSGYDIPFTVQKEEELRVYTTTLNGDSIVDSSKYTLSSDTTGVVATHITFASSYTFPEGSTKLTLIREVAITQEIDLKEGEKISANILEEGLDNGVRISLMLQEQLNRGILMSRSDEGAQIIVPNATDRAGRMLAFDESGQLASVLTSDIESNMNTALAAAESALASKNSAASFALAAATSEANAETSEFNAKASETKAKTSEENAKASETKSKASETNAATSEANAKTSETNTKNSENATKSYLETCEAYVAQVKADKATVAQDKATVQGYKETSEECATAAAMSEANAEASAASAAESAAKAESISEYPLSVVSGRLCIRYQID